MRVTGAATLSRPPDAVWSALNDPEVLARAIPGCERLDVTGAGTCALTVVAGIAAIAGTYAGEARAAERAAPGLIRASVSGSGNRGQVGADVTVRLEPSGDEATQVSYEADIRADGQVAAVGQRVLASVAKRLATQFLAGIDSELSAPAARRAVAADEPTVVIERVREPVAAGREPAPAHDGRADVESAEPPTVDLARVRAGETGMAPPEDRPAPARSMRSDVAGTGARGRAGLLAGAAAGVAGVAIGVLLGRRANGSRR